MEWSRRNKFLAASATVLLLIASIVIFGTDESQCPPRLAHIDSLMETNPQAAYDSLLHIDSLHVYDGDRPMEMRMRLLKAKAQNKLYLPMPSDSTFTEVVTYYDHHGSANDRMLSRYLLGCIYRDMKEAPKAVECFIEATEHSDTTDKKCDYNILSRIHGQLAAVYKTNKMYNEALEAHSCASYYALKSGNIYEHIRLKEFVGGDYYILHDTLKAINTAKECIQLYEKHQMYKDAASAYLTIIYTYVVKGQYDSAHTYIDKFENESGLFKDSEIEKGREAYYYTKGLYCLRINQTDSAMFYFRQLLKHGYLYEAYKGLADYYATTQKADSSKIYYELAENITDSTFDNCKSTNIRRLFSHYDRKQTNNEMSKNMYLLPIICLAVITIFAFYVKYLRKYRKSFICNRENKEKTTGIEKTEEQNECKNAFIVSKKDILDFKEQETGKLRHKACSGKSMSSYEKKTLKANAKRNLKHIYPIVFEKGILTEQEAMICILSLLGLKNGEIAVLVDTSAQRISNAKAIVNNKLFGSTGARSLFYNLCKSK